MKKLFFRIVIFLSIPVVLFGLWMLWVFADQYRLHQMRKEYSSNLQATASPNVQTLKDTAFIDYLNTTRTLYIYLPPNYHTDSLHYPVLYFFDGGALFDELVVEGPEWQVDEVIDAAVAQGKQGAIVIGIENSKDRHNEYNPFEGEAIDGDKPEVTGHLHAKWVATDLKAWVDQNFRTLPAPKHTTIGGASLGGLMSYYSIMTYPEVFGNAIVFSPSFWVSDRAFQLHEKVADLNALRIYFNVGGREGWEMKSNTRKMYKRLQAAGMDPAQLRMDKERGEMHWHPLWRKGFRKAYEWMGG